MWELKLYFYPSAGGLKKQTNEQTKNGSLPGRYRPPRCGNHSLRFADPAPPGEDHIPSPDQKSFHISTTPTNRGRKRCSRVDTALHGVETST